MYILLGESIYNLDQFISIRKEKDGVYGITSTGAKLCFSITEPVSPERVERLFKEITYILDGNKSGLIALEF